MSYLTVDELRIASPCSMPWSGMAGGDTVRHCSDCQKNVYNLSLLTRTEANNLIREKEGKICVSLYRRFDGTVLTADCSVGLRKLRIQYLKTRAVVITTVLTFFSVASGIFSSCASTKEKSKTDPSKTSQNTLMTIGDTIAIEPIDSTSKK